MKPSEHLDLGHGCRVTFNRTLRVPDDGRDHPLPPGLGAMTIHPAGEDEWVLPMWRAEATWLSFDAPWWKPHALKVGTGRVDAISGEELDPGAIGGAPQDDVVIPGQPWLDGFNAGGGMGVGAGGRIVQDIAEDEHGLDTWQPSPSRTVHVELVDALAFHALTGIPSAGPPVDAHAYAAHGLPWFDLLSPTQTDVAAAERLASVRSVADLAGWTDLPLGLSEDQVIRLLDLRPAPASGCSAA